MTAPSCPQHVPTKPPFPRPAKLPEGFLEPLPEPAGSAAPEWRQTWGKLTCVRTQTEPPLKSAARKQGFVLSIFNECPQGKNYFPIVALIKNKTKQKEPTVNT